MDDYCLFLAVTTVIGINPLTTYDWDRDLTDDELEKFNKSYELLDESFHSIVF